MRQQYEPVLSQIPILDLRPTQITVGMAEVARGRDARHLPGWCQNEPWTAQGR